MGSLKEARFEAGFFYARAGPIVNKGSLTRQKRVRVGVRWGSAFLPKKFALSKSSKIVQEMLGHSTISITLDTYSHVLPNIQKEAVNAMEGIVDPQKNE